jgi:hypothetical protein
MRSKIKDINQISYNYFLIYISRGENAKMDQLAFPD